MYQTKHNIGKVRISSKEIEYMIYYGMANINSSLLNRYMVIYIESSLSLFIFGMLLSAIVGTTIM